MSLHSRHTQQFIFSIPLLFACTSPEPATVVTSPETSSTGMTGSESTGDFPTEPTSISLTTSSESEPSTTTTTTSSATTGIAAFCGDGSVDEGEDCDLGADNRDDGACTLDCKAAYCGDGKVWADVEACDLGGDNSEDYAGCSSLCQKNAHCGDHVVDAPNEQCDAGPGNGSGQSEGGTTIPCTVGCTWDARVIFLSSALYDANFGGLDGADQRCRTLGKAAGIVRWNTLMAWLSSGTEGPLDRFVLLPTKPYMLPTGERIADDLSDLVLNGPGDGIRVDELGKPLPTSRVWTNTSVIGTPYDPLEHCSNWDSVMPGLVARVGRSHVPQQPEDVFKKWQQDKEWTSYQPRECLALARLYCVEQ
jgi:hypothetical protein